MGLLKALLSIAIISYVYYYMTYFPQKVKKVPYIGKIIYDKNPLIIIIITLVILHLL